LDQWHCPGQHLSGSELIAHPKGRLYFQRVQYGGHQVCRDRWSAYPFGPRSWQSGHRVGRGGDACRRTGFQRRLDQSASPHQANRLHPGNLCEVAFSRQPLAISH
jgi:hypothetical protein